MKMQSRPSPTVEYRNAGSNPFNGIRPATQTPRETPGKPVQAGAKAEKVSAQAPKPKQSQESFWQRYEGQLLTFQLRNGAIMTGTVSGLEKNYIRLQDTTITGRNHIAKTAWTMLDLNSISHFHPGSATVEAIS